MTDNFTTSLSENILALLIFNGDVAPLLASNIKIEYMENIYHKTIASKAIDYYHKYKEIAGEHISDLLEKEISSDKLGIYEKLLKSMFQNSGSINKKYVLDELENFIDGQIIKKSIRKAAEFVQSGEIDKAKHELANSQSKRISTFDPGTFFLKDEANSLTFGDLNDEFGIYTGIKCLDDAGIIPYPKELYTLVARAGSGKSWFLVHLGKFALMQHKKVLHITLELADDRLKGRYFQTLYGLVSKSTDIQTQVPIFKSDVFGNISDIDFRNIDIPKSLKDADIFDYLKDNMKKFHNPQLIIKEFPTGSLSVDKLKMYLDNLEGYYNFIPDIILLDYLDLMALDVERLRLDLGQTAIALRGIAVERNLAMVTVAQTNKTGEGIGLLTRKHLAEDFSKVRISDNLITYNQTSYEKPAGLARLYIDKARNSKDGGIILISQNYSTGQFCLSSTKSHSKSYAGILEGLGIDTKPVKI